MCEHTHTFNLVAEQINYLMLNCVKTKYHQQYSLNLLRVVVDGILNENKDVERREWLRELVKARFTDLVYLCTLAIQSGRGAGYTNQVERIQKIGPVRIRAAELLNAILKTGNEVTSLQQQCIIDSCFYLLTEFPYCSISHQQCYSIIQKVGS